MLENMSEKDFYKWLGKEFQALREKKGLKQKDVAKIADIGATTLSMFENSGKKISAYRILRLLKAIGSSMEEVLGDAEKKNLRSLSMAIRSAA